MTYMTILADPPWEQGMMGRYKKHKKPDTLPYPTMTLDQIKALPVKELADEACHLWLWTTNQFLRAGFDVLESWGFKFLCPITWVKPSGCGNWFCSRTQTILFGYKDRCRFPKARFRPNVVFAKSRRHSQKPQEVYELIEAVSPGPRLELFARDKRDGWDVWGNEIPCDIILNVGGQNGQDELV